MSEKQIQLEVESVMEHVSQPRRGPPLYIKFIATIICTLFLGLGFASGIVFGLRMDYNDNHTTLINTSNAHLSKRSDSDLTARGVSFKPAVGLTWTYQLITPPTSAQLKKPTEFQVWGIDLFDTPASSISTIQKAGSKVICYFSAGSYEPNRPDSANFTTRDKGNALDGYPDEFYLKLSSNNVRKIMKARLDTAVQKGCNGVDPDNVDGYNNNNGLSLTQADSINYMQFLATEASNRGLSIGLKNAPEIISSVISQMQWSVNEQCSTYGECTEYQPFINAGKPVFNVEYPKGATINTKNVTKAQYTKSCNDPDAPNFSKIIKNINLDTWIQKCS